LSVSEHFDENLTKILIQSENIDFTDFCEGEAFYENHLNLITLGDGFRYFQRINPVTEDVMKAPLGDGFRYFQTYQV